MSPSLLHLALLTFSAFHVSAKTAHDDSTSYASSERILYANISWPAEKPDYTVFCSAISGYQSLQDSLHLFKKSLITIIDFSRPSTDKRLWVIDLESKEVVLNTLVAHGRNSGDLMAKKFSNKHESFQSSLGFYATGQTYLGKHGLSLTLEGLEHGINDQASSRAIVIHGADYVSDRYVKYAGRLGRSQGCPAVSMEIHRKLIATIKEQTCLFIYSPLTDYFQKSKILPKTRNEESLAYHPNEFIERF